jgi:hypothetical protein
VNAITNDANARKQDFIALFKMVQSTEQALKNSTSSLETTQNMTFLKLHLRYCPKLLHSLASVYLSRISQNT